MYESVFSDEFKAQLSKLKKKDLVMYSRLEKKIKDLLLEPTHVKHLRNVLKWEQRVHLGSFVLRFRSEENKLYFITFKHHDEAY